MDRDEKSCEIWEGWKMDGGEGRGTEGGESELSRVGQAYLQMYACG